MKFLVNLLILLGICTYTNSQNEQKLKFQIFSFDLAETDLTARNDAFKKVDGSGKLYAIIKVSSTNPDDDLSAYQFNFGNMNHEVVNHDGELWIYVQRNAKMVTISREGYITIRKYDLKTTIQEGRTYELVLSSKGPTVKHRILQFKVTPSYEGMTIKFWREGSNENDFELLKLDATGCCDKRLELGNYRYEISREHYDMSSGRINLTSSSENYIENVTLIPNFGWLEVDNTNGIAGAEIYVDDKRIGTVPYTTKDEFDVGEHKIIISNGELYKPYSGTFVIAKGQTTRLSPRLESNFAETTIIVGNQAEIYINGKRENNGKWVGPLRAGTYDIECKLPNHRSTTRQITVKPNVAETFEMESPIPITGSIYVSTVPSAANIQIDGKEVGVTPYEIRDVLIGRHTIKVTKKDYRSEEETVVVKENQTEEVKLTMRDFANFTITSRPHASLYIDGKYKGSTPYSFEGTSGTYDIRLKAGKHYKEFHRSKVQLSSSQPEVGFKLTPNYQLRSCGYIQLGMQTGSLQGGFASLGFYANNINVEASFLYGLKESEEIHWVNTIATDERPVTCKYRPMAFGGKIGYGVVIGNRIRFTPQIGGTCTTFKSGEGDSKGNVISATGGARLDIAITTGIGLYVTPEYSVPIVKSDVYKQLEDLSDDIKKWGTGLNVRFGINFSF